MPSSMASAASLHSAMVLYHLYTTDSLRERYHRLAVIKELGWVGVPRIWPLYFFVTALGIAAWCRPSPARDVHGQLLYPLLRES